MSTPHADPAWDGLRDSGLRLVGLRPGGDLQGPPLRHPRGIGLPPRISAQPSPLVILMGGAGGGGQGRGIAGPAPAGDAGPPSGRVCGALPELAQARAPAAERTCERSTPLRRKPPFHSPEPPTKTPPRGRTFPTGSTIGNGVVKRAPGKRRPNTRVDFGLFSTPDFNVIPLVVPWFLGADGGRVVLTQCILDKAPAARPRRVWGGECVVRGEIYMCPCVDVSLPPAGHGCPPPASVLARQRSGSFGFPQSGGALLNSKLFLRDLALSAG